MLIFQTMKFLKVLSNAVLCALFFSGLIALLTYDININLPFAAGPFVRLALASAVFYGPIVVLATVVFFFLVQFFSGRRFALKAVSPSFLALALPLLIVLFLFIFWENLRYFASFFDPAHGALVRAQGIALAVLAISGAGALYASRRLGKKHLPLGAYFALFAAGLLLLAGLRARFPSPRPGIRTGRLEARKIGRNVCLIGLEGLSLDIVFPLIAEGKLPNFSWLVDNGSWGRLGTLAPTESALLDRSLETGKLPAKHRQLSTNAYEPAFRAPRLEVTPRYILFRQMIRLGLLQILPNVPPPAPTDLGRVFEANGSSSLVVAPPPAETRGDPDPRADKAFGQVFKMDGSETGRLLEAARKAFARDWALEEGAFAEKGRRAPGYFHLRLDGLNTVEAFFYKYSFPEQFGNIAPEELNRYGPVISRYYEFYDQLIGKYLTGLRTTTCSSFTRLTASSPFLCGSGSSSGSSGIPTSRPITRTSRTASCSSTGTVSGGGTPSRGSRSWTSPRRSSTTSGSPWARTWTGSFRAPYSSGTSRPKIPSSRSRRTKRSRSASPAFKRGDRRTKDGGCP